MDKLKLLVLFEYSQRVTQAFRILGVESYSCDILPTKGDPSIHYQLDWREAVDIVKPNFIIAHPPCTYLTSASAQLLFKKGIIQPERYQKMMHAAQTFRDVLSIPVPHIVVENPTPIKLAKLPPYSQIVHPHFFGDNHQKRTCLWIEGLPLLTRTHWIDNPVPFINKKGYSVFNNSNKAVRNLTSLNLASAMALQYTQYLSRFYSI